MILTEQITALQGQLAAAQSQAQENFRLLTEARTNLTTVTGERDAALLQVTALTTERDAAVTALAAEKENRQGAIDAEVTQRLASAGVEPVKRDPKAVDNSGEQKPQGTARERLAAITNAQIAK